MNNEGITKDFDVVIGTDLSSPTVRNLNIVNNGLFNVVDYDKVDVSINDEYIMNDLIENVYINKKLLNSDLTDINSGKYSHFCLQGFFIAPPKTQYTTIKDFFLDIIRIFDLTKIAETFISKIPLTDSDLDWFVNSNIHSLVGLYGLKPIDNFFTFFNKYILYLLNRPIIFTTNNLSNNIDLTKSKLDIISLLFFISSFEKNINNSKTIILSNKLISTNVDAFNEPIQTFFNALSYLYDICLLLNYTLALL